MVKKVHYNGGTQTYCSCTEPTNLIVGKEYEVIAERDRGFQTDYKLKGIEGEFNSVWFDEVQNSEKIYMALARKVPCVGKRCECAKVEMVNGRPKLSNWSTSIVKEVSLIGNNIYQVTTRNSVYIIQVG